MGTGGPKKENGFAKPSAQQYFSPPYAGHETIKPKKNKPKSLKTSRSYGFMSVAAPGSSSASSSLPVVFLDIETSGLNPDSDFISCVGVLELSRGMRVFSGHEKQLLVNTLALLDELAMEGNFRLVTYNGESFDLPFVKARCRKNGLPDSLGLFEHLDLMHAARENLGKDRNGQKTYVSKDTACHQLGIYVPSTAPGFQCALLAKESLKDRRALIDVLVHNAVDLGATAKLYEAMLKWGWIQ